MTPNLFDVLRSMRSQDFARRFHSFEHYDDFLATLATDSDVQSLLQNLRLHGDVDCRILVQFLTKYLPALDTPDFREHPFDAAVAAWLYALNEAQCPETRELATKITGDIRMRFARRVAEDILKRD
jgi:hypothetical protein